MRVLVVAIVVAGLARVASAGDRTCYAGTETLDATPRDVVVVRELDRGANEIRQHEWSSQDYEVETTRVFKVDAKAGTFEVGGKLAGTGTLDGAAWQWTGYHAKLSRATIPVELDGQVDARRLVATMRAIDHGKVIMTSHLEATSFDCTQLEPRRRALNPAAADAVRSCYLGAMLTDTAFLVPAILVQTVDAGRIEVRWRVARMTSDHVRGIKIDGTKLAIDGNGAGEVTGKPGAWTGYAWHSSGTPISSAIEGTVGGAATRRSDTRSRALERRRRSRSRAISSTAKSRRDAGCAPLDHFVTTTDHCVSRATSSAAPGLIGALEPDQLAFVELHARGARRACAAVLELPYHRQCRRPEIGTHDHRVRAVVAGPAQHVDVVTRVEIAAQLARRLERVGVGVGAVGLDLAGRLVLGHRQRVRIADVLDRRLAARDLVDRDDERAVDRAAMQRLAAADLRLVGSRAVQAVAVVDGQREIEVRDPGDVHADDAPCCPSGHGTTNTSRSPDVADRRLPT